MITIGYVLKQLFAAFPHINKDNEDSVTALWVKHLSDIEPHILQMAVDNVIRSEDYATVAKVRREAEKMSWHVIAYRYQGVVTKEMDKYLKQPEFAKMLNSGDVVMKLLEGVRE